MAAIRTTDEINQIINMSQHALGDLGLQFIQEEQQGIDTSDVAHRDKMYRIVLLNTYLLNILDDDANIRAYYLASANEKKFNAILDGLVQLSLGFSGPAISIIGVRRNLYFLNNPNAGGGGGGGGGPANPGGTTFQNLGVDAPGELIDTFDANQSTFALYLYSVTGSNPGEGSRTGMIMASWNGSNDPEFAEIKTPDVGGITTPITFTVDLNAGQIEFNAATSTDGWVVKGVRILFQNISFINPVGPLPVGGLTGQFLRKASNSDYDATWQSLIWTMITDVTASLTEINYVAGVTSPIQTQLNTLVANLAAEAVARAAADSTLQTNINNEATTRGNADTTLQANINAEAASRAAADTTLQNNINAEAATRSAADAALSASKANKTQSAFTLLPLASVLWSTDPGGYNDAGYMVDEFGKVNLRGVVTLTGGSPRTNLLSSGWLSAVNPAKNRIDVSVTDSFGNVTDNVLIIQSDGTGTLQVAVSSGSSVSLDGKSFWTY